MAKSAESQKDMSRSVLREHRLTLFAIWLFAAGLSGPVGILLHELGHFGVAVACRFPECRINFASVSYQNSQLFWQTLAAGDRESAANIYPIHLAGWVAAAGPAVTALLILISTGILYFAKPHSFLAAFLAGMALMAGVRSITGIYYILAVRPYYPDARPFFDEINVARAFELSVDWIAWPSVILVLLAWVFIVPKLTPDRWLKLTAAILGPILGIAMWSQIGPVLMP